jgi:poly(A) polymerase
MDDVLVRMQQAEIPFFLESYSALDRYFRVKEPGDFHLLTDSTLVSLAKVFENLQYPGLPYEDACLQREGHRYVFRCVDNIDRSPPHPFTAQHLLYSVSRDAFLDPQGVYEDLRREHLVEAIAPIPAWLVIMEAAKLVSRYHYAIDDIVIDGRRRDFVPTDDALNELLTFLLSSRYPEKGLELLEKSGFVEAFWPELHAMTQVLHSKDYHPEGNVWEHTMESLRHRKSGDLRLSMALLLHDIGKPVAKRLKEKPFKNHADLGARISASFLRHLGFPLSFVRDVCFLVRYHMLPAALGKMPLYRIERILDSPLFPTLLELYRADLSSTFLGPEKYYEACRIYRTYQKKQKNPYQRLQRGRRVMDQRPT